VGSTVIPSTQARRTAPKPPANAFVEEAEATIFGNADETGEQPTIIAVDHELLKQSIDSFSSSSAASSAASSAGEIISPPEPETILPLALALPIPEEEEDIGSSRGLEDFGMSSNSLPQAIATNPQSITASIHSQSFNGSSLPSKKIKQLEGGEAEVLTSSMQSLVDGLMNWGGRYDDDEDLALPTGMAASIALEESMILGSHSAV
jgi:hypothetical protein